MCVIAVFIDILFADKVSLTTYSSLLLSDLPHYKQLSLSACHNLFGLQYRMFGALVS